MRKAFKCLANDPSMDIEFDLAAPSLTYIIVLNGTTATERTLSVIHAVAHATINGQAWSGRLATALTIVA